MTFCTSRFTIWRFKSEAITDNFEYIGSFSFQLHCEIIPFSIGGQIGFLEKNLDVIIKPEYQDCSLHEKII